MESLFARQVFVRSFHKYSPATSFYFLSDVRTQAMYQLLDSGFIGLIFSCFSEDMNKVCVKYIPLQWPFKTLDSHT